MTLTQVAIITKRGVLTFTALLILGTVTAIGYRVWYNYYQSTLPIVEEKPNLKFGTLPKIVFPKSIVSSSNYSYSLDTETGSFLQMPKIIKVYFIPRANIVSLLAPDESQKLAGKFGFNGSREVLNPTTYQYKDDSNGKFIIDLISGNFNFQKQVATASAKIDTTFINPDQLVNAFKDLLKMNGVSNDDLNTGRSKVAYNKNIPNNSNSALVSLWPADFDGVPIVTSSTSASLVNATTSNPNNESNRFTEVNYTYWQIDKTTFATYPLQPIENAFEELKLGQGYITQVPTNAKVSIIKAYLAYFESEEYTPYLQPVYVFEGPLFTALVPAIKID
ncbi:MAG: hypothetical protein PHQ59_02100 [Candidatus Daviesbacteria bacterium]|nr:hypothetical protein [Candidatus Daviesbacteria bacterium]